MKIRTSSMPMKTLVASCIFLAVAASLRLGFGQNAASGPLSAPQIFAPGVVSTGHEFGLSFMPDAKEAYFTRFDADKKTNHIYRAIRMDGKWQDPTLVEFSNDSWRDLDAAVSPDGKELFFISTRPKPGAPPNAPANNMDIWVADRNGQGWNEPHWLDNVNSDAKEGSPSVDRDGTLYFFSNRGNSENSNSIYCATHVNGKYSTPQRLPAEVNSGISDTSPFISPDGKTLLFYSSRPGGYGKGDLYVSFKKHGAWTPAINLGASVNTADSEYNPTVSPDGNYLYFGRSRNIYVVKLQSLGLKFLRPKLFR